MASFEPAVAGGKGCSSPPPAPPPPYGAEMMEEAGRRSRVLPPVYSKGVVVRDVVQDETRRQDEKSELFVVSWLYRECGG